MVQTVQGNRSYRQLLYSKFVVEVNEQRHQIQVHGNIGTCGKCQWLSTQADASFCEIKFSLLMFCTGLRLVLSTGSWQKHQVSHHARRTSCSAGQLPLLQHLSDHTVFTNNPGKKRCPEPEKLCQSNELLTSLPDSCFLESKIYAHFLRILKGFKSRKHFGLFCVYHLTHIRFSQAAQDWHPFTLSVLQCYWKALWMSHLAISLLPQSTSKLAVKETFKVKRVKANPIPEAFSSFEKILEGQTALTIQPQD